MNVEDWVSVNNRTIKRFTWGTHARAWRAPEARGALVFERADTGARVRIDPVPRSWFYALRKNTNRRDLFRQLVLSVSTGWTQDATDTEAYDVLDRCRQTRHPRDWTRAVVTTTRILGVRDKHEYAPNTGKVETLGTLVAAANLHHTRRQTIDTLGARFDVPPERIREEQQVAEQEHELLLDIIGKAERNGGPPCFPRRVKHQTERTRFLDTTLSAGWPP